MLMDALQLITILVMSGVRKEIIKMTGKEYVSWMRELEREQRLRGLSR